MASHPSPYFTLITHLPCLAFSFINLRNYYPKKDSWKSVKSLTLDLFPFTRHRRLNNIPSHKMVLENTPKRTWKEAYDLLLFWLLWKMVHEREK